MLAVFKRNFSSYFLNPTGYVFICVFVLLCSGAAFLPDEFVVSNLANLVQLNLWFPLIAIFFVPAISMGVWADEKRQGTDELLMIQPISPVAITIGKYLAVLAVYTVSLLFSAISNLVILEFLGEPDIGLFFATYCGYWLVGAATAGIASVVSYLTSQLTVAYILGALFNTPLVLFKWADALPIPGSIALFLKSFSIDSFLEPFGRGIISLSGFVYFLSIVILSIYLSVIFLTRNTWTAHHLKKRCCMYLYRVVASSMLLLALVGLAKDHELHLDCTAEKLSSLSAGTFEILNKIQTPYPITIEARLSPHVPQEYVQTKLDVISILNELQKRSHTPIFLDIKEIMPNTPEAYRLERQYDIRPRTVVFNTRGQLREDSIYLTIIFHCGSRSIVIPFFNRGLSVEYELISSLKNVTTPPQKRIGIVKTDAGVLGRINDYGQEINKPWPLVEELSKQYIVESVDPSNPIDLNQYSVLLAFQPSSLGPVEFLNFVNAVRQGQPTAIFEDPLPIFLNYLTGTNESKRPTPTCPIPPLKGEINLLWSVLGVRFEGGSVLWKNYNPYPKLATLSEEYLFVDARPIQYQVDEQAAPKDLSNATFDTFNKDDLSVASLERLLFPFAGAISQLENSETTFTPLVSTWAGGYSSTKDVVPNGIRARSLKRTSSSDIYTLAAHITGTIPSAFQVQSSSPVNSQPQLNTILVADVDATSPGFFTLREMGSDVRNGIVFDFDNITFLLNIIDHLADEDSLISIRSRRPKHRTLTKIEDSTRKIREEATAAQIVYMREFEEERRKEELALQRTVEELSSRDPKQKELNREESVELQSSIVATQQRLQTVLEEKKRKIDRKVEEEQREVDEFVRQMQGRYKTYATLIPPLPPLAIGLVVFIYRKKRRGSEFGF